MKSPSCSNRGWRSRAILALLALLGGAVAIAQAAAHPVAGAKEETLPRRQAPPVAAPHPRQIPPPVTTHDGAPDEDWEGRAVAAGPAQAPGPVLFHTTTVTIPTYPYTAYLSHVYTPTYNITYTVLNWNAYNASHPTPVPQEYELLVLENDYLRVTLLPELGGRVYQMVFKPTSHDELYQNPVIKPNAWGPPEQGWWLAAGGIEWCLPVEEHGYEWGEPWDYQVLTSTAGVTVTLRDTSGADRIRAAIAVHLPADRAYLAIRPRIDNPTGHDIAYKYWTNGMLAPGAANTVTADLRFVFAAQEMAVHSTSDDRLPGHDATLTGPDHRFSWPVYNGTDFSRLGNWQGWLGFFEYPQAAGDFAGVYDTAADEGVVRVFPSDAAHGSKGFGFGWSDALDPDLWTDDDSTFVELHGGVAPTFWDAATLTAGQQVAWTEYWYPVSGIGQLITATEEVALGARESGGRFTIGVHASAPRAAGEGALYVWDRNDCSALGHWALPDVAPGDPFVATLATGGRTLDNLSIVYADAAGGVLAAANPRDCLPPSSSVEPLPPWVATTGFTVTWSGRDSWEGVAAYDVQVRDGYEGAWTGWLTGTVATSGVYTGTHGHTYWFRARAHDRQGNAEPYSGDEWGQAFTTVLIEPAPVLVTSRKSAAPHRFGPGQAVSYTVLVSNTGNLTATAALTDTPPPVLAVLPETLSGTLGLTLFYGGTSIQWAGQVAPGGEVRITYALSSTPATPLGVGLTNTAEIAGSVLGPFTRRETVVLHAHFAWLPSVVRGWDH